MGLVGFGNTVAIEGRKHNILVNTIAPTAFTRLTEGLMPQGIGLNYEISLESDYPLLLERYSLWER